MFVVYILQSKIRKRFYIGHTEDIRTRLDQHNNCKVKSTKAYTPWEVVHLENFETKSEAYRREMQIKSYKGGEAFKKLVV